MPHTTLRSQTVLPGARPLTRLGEAATDLANRQAVPADPGKDLADHAGFVREDLIAGLPAPLILGHIAVPIGRAAQHIDRPAVAACRLPRRCRSMILARSYSAIMPCTCSSRSSSGLWPKARFKKMTSTPGTAKLIDQQDLVGIFPRQAVGRVDIESVHTARGDHIAQALQRRADQGGPTIAFIQKLHGLGHGQAIDGDALAQGRHLTGDGLGLGLLLGRHAGVDRYLDGFMSAVSFLPVAAAVRSSAWL